MNTEPQIENRSEQHYAAIRSKVTMKEVPTLLPPLISEVFKWLELNNIKPAGAPFFHYLKLENGQLTVDVGVPVNSLFTGSGRVISGTFPTGKYIVANFGGHYNNLPKIHMEIEKWREKSNVRIVGTRTEFYPTDPEVEPNPDKWHTIIMAQVDNN